LIPNIGRDQEFSMKALDQFQVLIKRYPNSEYVNDAKLKMDLTYDHLAGEEMDIGRYYLKKDLFIAAINRFKAVVTSYQKTIHIEEALARLVESYMALGIISEAQTAAAILGYNYPGSEWYKDSYNLLQNGGLSPKEDTNSWISKTWRSVNPI
jgi:outer membrane protein assembly factor BamD